MTCQGCGKPVARRSKMGRPPKWCSDRCRKDEYLEPCAKCGAPCNPRSNSAGKHFKSCAQDLSTQRNREIAAPKRKLIERLWSEGLPARQIAERAGWSTASPATTYIAAMRSRGYDLPVRNRGSSEANKQRHATARKAA